MAEAAAAKKALQDLGDAVKKESADETAGATAATAARKADSAAIKQEIADLAALKAAAEAANVQTEFGGRSTMDQHLSDMQRELQYKTLLNRAEWLGFTTPQQAYAWKQQELSLKRLSNYADWAGYTSPDQYLNYLAKQKAQLDALNSSTFARAQAFEALASAALDYNDALAHTSKTLGQLGEAGTVGELQDALAGLPDSVSVELDVDDKAAMGELASYRAALAAVPREIDTREVIHRAALGSAASLAPEDVAARSPAGQFGSQLAQVSALRSATMAEEQEAAATRAQAAMKDYLQRWAAENLTPPAATPLTGGASGGGGGPPPPVLAAPQPEGPDPHDAAAFEALAHAALGADDAAGEFAHELQQHVVPSVDDAVAHLGTLTAGSAKAASQLSYAIGQLKKISQDKLEAPEMSGVAGMVGMAAEVTKAGDASKLAYAALKEYKQVLADLDAAAGQAAQTAVPDLAQHLQSLAGAAAGAAADLGTAAQAPAGLASASETAAKSVESSAFRISDAWHHVIAVSSDGVARFQVIADDAAKALTARLVPALESAQRLAITAGESPAPYRYATTPAGETAPVYGAVPPPTPQQLAQWQYYKPQASPARLFSAGTGGDIEEITKGLGQVSAAGEKVRAEVPAWEAALEGLLGGLDNTGHAAAGTAQSVQEATDRLADAIHIIVSSQFGSTNMLARQLNASYSEAEELMGKMEELGIVGPQEYSSDTGKPLARDVNLPASDAGQADALAASYETVIKASKQAAGATGEFTAAGDQAADAMPAWKVQLEQIAEQAAKLQQAVNSAGGAIRNFAKEDFGTAGLGSLDARAAARSYTVSGGGEAPNPQDQAAWEALAGAVHDADDDFAHAAREAADLGDVLSGTVVTGVDAAIKHLEGLNVTTAQAASQVSWAIEQLRKLSQEKISSLGMSNVQGLIDMIAKVQDAASASKLAYAALETYKRAIADFEAASGRLATGDLLKLSQGFLAARNSADAVAAVVKETKGSFIGWTSEFTLWGGAFGANMAGMVKGWHLWMDALVETSAVTLPALAAMGTGLAAFATYAYGAGNTVKGLVTQLLSMHTVAGATGDPIGPFTQSMDKFQHVFQPQVWEVAGDAMLVLQHNAEQSGKGLTGFGLIAQQTGSYIDGLAARITDKLEKGGGQGLENFFKMGSADLGRLGTLFKGLGSVIGDFIRAAQQTQVAEKLFTILGIAAQGLARALGAIPTPVLAAAIGFHSFLVYGGLFTTWLQRAAFGIDGLIAKIPGLEGFALKFAKGIGASSDQLETLAAKSTTLKTLGDQLGVSALDAARLTEYVKSTGQTMEEFATSTQHGTMLMEQYAAGLDKAGKEAVATTIALGGTEEQVAKVASTQSAGSLTGLAKAFGISAADAENLAAQAASAEGGVRGLASGVSGGEDMLSKYGKGLSGAGQDAVALAVTLGGTEEQIASVAGEAEKATTVTGTVSKAFSGLGGFLASNWLGVAALAAAAFGFIATKALSASSGTQAFLTGLQKGLQNVSAAQAFVTIPDDLGKIEQQIRATNKAWTDEVGWFGSKGALNDWSSLWDRWREGWDKFWHAIWGGGGSANPDLNALNAELQKELKSYNNMADTIGYLSKQGYSFAQSLGILSAAGVSTSDSLSLMETKVKGLIAGYQLAGQQGGTLGNDIDALNVISAEAVTQTGKLNQAWDTFTTTVSGPITSFLTLHQAVTQFQSDAKAAGASMTGMSAASTTLQSDFESTFSDVEQQFDSLRLAFATAGASDGGAAQFTRAVKDSVAELLPLTGGSKAAVAQVSALAQEAGGPATTSVKSLQQWVGNIKNPMKDLADVTNDATIKVSNLNQDAATLTTTVQQELIPTMAASIISASKVGPAMQDFASAVMAGHTNIKALAPSADVLISKLVSVAGNTTNAKALFVGMAESMGLSRNKADDLWTYYQQHEIKPKADTKDATKKLQDVRDTAKKAATAPKPTGWAAFNSEMVGFFTKDLHDPLARFFTKDIPGWWNDLTSGGARAFNTTQGWWNRYVHAPVASLFTKDVPHWWDSFASAAGSANSRVEGWWTRNLHDPLARLFTKDIPSWWDGFTSGGAHAFDKTQSWWNSYIHAPVAGFFTKTIPQWWDGFSSGAQSAYQSARSWWNSSIAGPVGSFFTRTVPQWWNGFSGSAQGAFQTAHSWWNTNIGSPLASFFSRTVPQWWSGFTSSAQGAFRSTRSWWDTSVGSPLTSFFSRTVPGWWDGFTGHARSAFSDVHSWWDRNISSPLGTWFSKTMPDWINSIPGKFGKAWSGAWHDFSTDLLSPVRNFFTKTVPGWLGLAGGGDPRRASGSVPGSAEGDNYPAVVMGGEYVVRQPARMALEAAYGRGFMDWLNQYDTHSAAGSRGVLASQRGPGGTSGRYASGGLLGDITNFVSSGFSDIGKLGKSGLSGLEKLFDKGVKGAFDTAWDSTAGALLGRLPKNLPGDIARFLGDEAKKELDTGAGKVDAKTGAGGNLSGLATAFGGGKLGSGQAKAEQLYALSQFPRYGWPAGDLSALISLWNQESGWNPDAVNPSSGAYGIPQALGHGHPYALGDYKSQINWGLNYIKGRYGSPVAAEAHELANHWYAGGGPVVSAILDQTPDRNVREAMLMGSYLISGWNPDHIMWNKTSFGPYNINPSKHKGVTKSEAQNPTWATRFAYPYYRTAASHVAARYWASNPEYAAWQASIEAEKNMGTPLFRPTGAQENAAWHAVEGVIPITPAPKQSATKGSTPAQLWNYWSSQLGKRWNSSESAWKNLAAKTQPHGSKTSDWARWLAARRIGTWTMGMVGADWRSSNTPNPVTLAGFTDAEWTKLLSDIKFWESVADGKAIPSSYWGREAGIGYPRGYKAGHVDPGYWIADHWYAGERVSAYNNIASLYNQTAAAYSAWKQLHPPAKGGGTPGVTIRNPSAGNIPQPVNLGSLITGGPSGGTSNTTGFAAGGDPAALFAAGGAVPAPSFLLPGASATMAKQLSGAAQGSLPRTMSDAAGENVGLKVGQLTINNPVPAASEDSIARASNRLAFMAGRGPY